MMLYLDHLTIIAPSLADGVGHVRTCLDIDMPYGGIHPDMGTHNHRLRLGEATYLEVIAVDPDALAPSWPRWFGLSDAGAVRSAWENGLRLRGWVAGTDDMDAVLASHGNLLGGKIRMSRGGRSYSFSLMPDGSLPAGGVAPSVIDREGGGSPVMAMPDLGARLAAFVIEHPDPAGVAGLYETLGVDNPPKVQKGPTIRYRATIETPSGRKELY